MSKYHIKPDGTPGICSAISNCPYGSDSFHFASEDAALEYSDRINYYEATNYFQYATIETDLEIETIDKLPIKTIALETIEFLDSAELEAIIKAKPSENFKEAIELVSSSNTTVSDVVNTYKNKYNTYGEFDLNEHSLGVVYDFKKYISEIEKPYMEVPLLSAGNNHYIHNLTFEYEDGEIVIDYDPVSSAGIVRDDIYNGPTTEILMYEAIFNSPQYKKFTEDVNIYEEKLKSAIEYAKNYHLQNQDLLNSIDESVKISKEENHSLYIQRLSLYERSIELEKLAKKELNKRIQLSQKYNKAILEKTSISPEVKLNSNGEIDNILDENGNRIIGINHLYPYQETLGHKSIKVIKGNDSIETLKNNNEMQGWYTIEKSGKHEKIYTMRETKKEGLNTDLYKVYVIESDGKNTGKYFNFPVNEIVSK